MADAIEKLIEGFKAFRAQYYEGRPDFYRSLVREGQRPEVMVIACSDSRVNPSIIAKAEPGELFILRNVANLVPPHNPDHLHHGTSAAVEFAVRDLGVKHIIVLGHSHCGGIKALCCGHDDGGEREFVDDWMAIVDEARHTTVDDNYLRRVERKAVTVSLANLVTFPWVREGVEAGEITLHGWWFDLEEGELLDWDGGKWDRL